MGKRFFLYFFQSDCMIRHTGGHLADVTSAREQAFLHTIYFASYTDTCELNIYYYYYLWIIFNSKSCFLLKRMQVTEPFVRIPVNNWCRHFVSQNSRLLCPGPIITNFLSQDLRLRKNGLIQHYNLLSNWFYVLKTCVNVTTDSFHGCLYIIFLRMIHFNERSHRHL